MIHTYSLPAEGYDNTFFYKDLVNENMNLIEEKFKKLLNQGFIKDVSIEKIMLSGVKLWEIITDEQFKDTDILIMGSHGSSGISKIFIGSNTERIVRLANYPVLTIKNEIENFDIKNMVFASNFNEESYTIFKKIKFFADLYQTHIHLLKVITQKEFEPTRISKILIEDFAKRFDLTDYSINIYNARSIEKGIIDFSDEINADLVAIETHGRTGITHLINRSLAEDIASHEERPVLSIKIKDTHKHTSHKNSKE